MHTNLETIVTDFNEARGGSEESEESLEGASDIGKVGRKGGVWVCVQSQEKYLQ